MLWFEYKKETNIFCVATISVALLNIVLNIIFLNRYFNDTFLNTREFWYVILQPLPLFVVLVLFVASKLSAKAVVGM